MEGNLLFGIAISDLAPGIIVALFTAAAIVLLLIFLIIFLDNIHEKRCRRLLERCWSAPSAVRRGGNSPHK
jgi:hypothetical protein